MPSNEIQELIAPYCKSAIPTYISVVSFEIAKKLLPFTSETALQNFTASRKSGVHRIVCGGGNSCARVRFRLRIHQARPDQRAASVKSVPTLRRPVSSRPHCIKLWTPVLFRVPTPPVVAARLVASRPDPNGDRALGRRYRFVLPLPADS